MITNVNTNEGLINISGLPNECPFCHKTVTPNTLYGYRSKANYLEVFMHCPNTQCNSTFIGYYKRENAGISTFYYNNQVSKGKLIGRTFKQIITDISIQFTVIYNQAFLAEQQNLFEICGVGYRKVLEFLIKDYMF